MERWLGWLFDTSLEAAQVAAEEEETEGEDEHFQMDEESWDASVQPLPEGAGKDWRDP